MTIENRTSGLKIGYTPADRGYYWHKVERERFKWLLAGSVFWFVVLFLAAPLAHAQTTTPKFATVFDVFDYIQRITHYESDQELYGKLDYWATPEETLSFHAGDCEDYCILAISLAAQSGVGYGAIMIVQLTSGEGHTFVLMNGQIFDPLMPHGAGIRMFTLIKVIPYNGIGAYGNQVNGRQTFR